MSTNLRTNWLIAIALIGWLMWLLAPVLTPFRRVGAARLHRRPGWPTGLQRLKLPRAVAVVAVFPPDFFFAISLLVLLVVPLIRGQVAAFLSALPGLIAQVEQEWLPHHFGHARSRGERRGCGARRIHRPLQRNGRQLGNDCTRVAEQRRRGTCGGCDQSFPDTDPDFLHADGTGTRSLVGSAHLCRLASAETVFRLAR